MLIGWLAAVALGGPCTDELDKAGIALASPDVSDRVGLAAAALWQACPGGGPLVDAAEQITQVPPGLRSTLDLKLATDATELWLGVCPEGGLDVLIRMAQVAADEKRELVWDGCAFDDLGHVTRDEWVAGDGLVVLPLVASRVLADQGVSAATTRAMVRALSGVPDGRSPGDLTTFEPVETTQPAFAQRVRPDWSKPARREDGATCLVRVGVKPTGELRKVVFLECPEVLRADVQAAIEASTLTAATHGGEPLPGKFEATYTVGAPL